MTCKECGREYRLGETWTFTMYEQGTVVLCPDCTDIDVRAAA